jgi:hypothetical protein
MEASGFLGPTGLTVVACRSSRSGFGSFVRKNAGPGFGDAVRVLRQRTAIQCLSSQDGAALPASEREMPQ